MEIGLQLYSIKDETKQDMLDALRRVGEIGYKGVEFAGYMDISAKEMKNTLSGNGLRSIGTHIGLQRITDALDEEIEYNLEIGSKYIILPYANYETKDEVLGICEALNQASNKAKKHGLIVGYHNHNHEFKKFDGKYIYDILIENTCDDVVFEFDVYWAAVADVDPIDYIKTRRKIELIHIKELSDYTTKKNADVGSGVLDFPSIIAAAKAGGAKEFIVEQEKTDGDVWDSITNGVNYLNSILP
ncbi:MAG: sugar phosphate isomerase/epimerase [Clostridiaceae bacterium]|nr:sugar phosphate isomerase/epimerase [Clostridiaceae bacterium]